MPQGFFAACIEHLADKGHGQEREKADREHIDQQFAGIHGLHPAQGGFLVYLLLQGTQLGLIALQDRIHQLGMLLGLLDDESRQERLAQHHLQKAVDQQLQPLLQGARLFFEDHAAEGGKPREGIFHYLPEQQLLALKIIVQQGFIHPCIIGDLLHACARIALIDKILRGSIHNALLCSLLIFFHHTQV